MNLPTTLFYAPPDAIRGDRITLPDDEAHHASRVLRKQTGDVVEIVDGERGWYRIRLDQVHKSRVAGTIIERCERFGEPDYDLTIGMALLKKTARFETFLEKAVELGVRRVIPLITERTEKRQVRDSRARHILVAAMKQCGRSRLLELTEPMPLGALLATAPPPAAFICHEREEPGNTLMNRLPIDARALQILIGPEGGFSPDEIEAAASSGYCTVSLGPRRLRAETAAMAAAAAVMFVMNRK